MKIICVGWNYPQHNKEMDNTLISKNPTIFLKPETALLKDGKPFYIPDFTQKPEYEAEVVVRISRLGKNISEKFASRYYDAVTLGIDMTARDLQAEARKNGEPWDISKGFDNSAVIGSFIPVTEVSSVNEIAFKLDINGKCVQNSNTSEMIYPIDLIVSYVSRFFTLKTGDLIFTGTPSGVGGIAVNDHFEGFINDKKLLDFQVL